MAQRNRLVGILLGVGLAGLAGWISAARKGRKPALLPRIRGLGRTSSPASHPGDNG